MSYYVMDVLSDLGIIFLEDDTCEHLALADGESEHEDVSDEDDDEGID